MTSADRALRHHIYHRRFFDESPTWFAWNKLTAADVFALRDEPGFEGQDIYFCLNHPIRYVRLVGVVVAIELIPGGRCCLITIDDSSGAVIEVKIERQKIGTGEHAEFLANTQLDNVAIFVKLSEPFIHVDGKLLEIGTVVRAQGTITSFRQERQLHLKRIAVVKDTNEESIHWSKVADWKRKVLSKPWVLTEQQQKNLEKRQAANDRVDEEKTKRERKAKKKREQKMKLKEEQMKLMDEKRERKRQALEKMMNAGALPGSERLPLPWT